MTLDTPSAVRLRGVTAGYGDRVALADVELDIKVGSLLAVIGPNGSGKSTLLKTIAGLLRPFSGTVEVFGGPARLSAKRIAYVPQAELVDWAFPVTVGDVVMMGRVPLIGLGRSPGRADREAVASALDTVRMTTDRDRQVGALSGGQRRRVFLAKALAAKPDLYLLDEPVTGVDVTTQEDLMRILEAESACRADRRGHDARPGQRRAPLPPGGLRQRPHRGVRAGRPGHGSGVALGDLWRPCHRPAGRRADRHR